jgi:hypothetical protein
MKTKSICTAIIEPPFYGLRLRSHLLYTNVRKICLAAV